VARLLYVGGGRAVPILTHTGAVSIEAGKFRISSFSRRVEMRKPISKHGLRRALERVHAEGDFEIVSPLGTVVDKLWHEIERAGYAPGRKKPIGRESVRTPDQDADISTSL